MSSYSILWLAALLLTAVAGRIAGPGSGLPSIVLGAAGALAFAVTLFRWLAAGSVRSSLTIIGGSSLFALWTSGVVWGRIYKNPLFFENLAVNGMVHHDSLHLAAFANMLRTYGVASTGLDGLPYIPYHWGTPWLFAQWSNLLGVSVLDFYQLAFPVMMIPFFFGGILAAATEIVNLEFAEDLRNDLRPWLLLLAAGIGFIPITALDAMGVWTSNVVISESYAVAVPVALLLFSATLVFWRGLGNRVADAVFAVVVLPLGIVALGYLKISLMILGFLLAIYIGIRLGVYKRPVFVAGGILLSGLVAITYPLVSLPAHNEGLSPLDFMGDYVPRRWWPFFFVAQLFWSWVYVVLRVRRERVRTLGDLSAAIRDRRLLDVEAVALVALAGVAPGLIIHIDGGSAFYFSDVQRWLAVTLLIAGAGSLLRWQGRDAVPLIAPVITVPESRATTPWSLRGAPASHLLLVFIGIPMVVTMGFNATRWAGQMLRENAATRRALYSASGAATPVAAIGALSQLTDPSILQPALRSTRRFIALGQLGALNGLPHADRRRTALFIPQSESMYWSILARPGACTFAPFVAPALSGMAMVDGMPAVGCELSRYYGIGSYAPRTRPQTGEDASPAVLCGKARHSGLDRVLVLRFDDAGMMQPHRLDC